MTEGGGRGGGGRGEGGRGGGVGNIGGGDRNMKDLSGGLVAPSAGR